MDWPLLTVSAFCSSEARGVIVSDFNLIKALSSQNEALSSNKFTQNASAGPLVDSNDSV